MTVKKLKELKEFRAKLVKARVYEKKLLSFPEDTSVLQSLVECGLPESMDVARFIFSLMPNNRRAGVAALFANSIAAIDAQIAGAKP